MRLPHGAGIMLVALLATACTGGVTASNASASGSAGSVAGAVDFVRLTDATPAERTAAAIEVAFDGDAAQRLARGTHDIDFATRALLCLSLGERPTGGWSVTIQSMRVDAGALRILARDVRPRAGEGTTQAFTYPADCVVLDRTRLSAGRLAVRADDTISDEFIVDATIEVPPR
jgi:hypothetical protein